MRYINVYEHFPYGRCLSKGFTCVDSLLEGLPQPGTTGAAMGHSDRQGCLGLGPRVASNRKQVKLALIFFLNNLLGF